MSRRRYPIGMFVAVMARKLESAGAKPDNALMGKYLSYGT